MIAARLFAEGVTKEIKNYLSPEFSEAECTVTENEKNNGVKRVGICFRNPGQQTAPVVYIEPYYDYVRNGDPMNEIMQEIARCAEKVMSEKVIPVTMNLEKYEDVREHLSLMLINTKQNQRMLSEMPHMKMEDLSLIPIVSFSMKEENSTGCMKIKNEMLDIWNVSREQVFKDAVRNAPKKEAPVLLSMESVMKHLLEGEKEEENLLAADGVGIQGTKDKMYVLSNTERNYGATVLVYPSVMKKISQIFPKGFYILPSSVHETLIVPKPAPLTPKELGEMVRAVNQKEVDREEFLSDRVYEYDKERGKIIQVPESIERGKEMER